MPNPGLMSIAFPLMILIPVLKDRGPATRFLQAGAVSSETARKPATVQAKGDLTGAVKSGLLIDLGDGRYYVDARLYRRRRNRQIIGFGCLGVALAVAALLIWPPWGTG